MTLQRSVFTLTLTLSQKSTINLTMIQCSKTKAAQDQGDVHKGDVHKGDWGDALLTGKGNLFSVGFYH